MLLNEKSGTLMKPVIGLTPCFDKSNGNTYINPGYPESVMLAGGLPLVLPLTEDEAVLGQCVSLCDGFLFTGGPDVDPALFGETPLNDSVNVCPERDAMEFALLKQILCTGKPVFGICRGCQLLNVGLGGDLYQDLPAQCPGPVEHRQPEPFTVPVHENRILPETPLRTLLGVDIIRVNSCHHQAIRTLAPGLRVSAVSEDGLTEAFWMEEYPYLQAVQWHPERMLKDEASLALFRAFILAAETGRKTK